VKLSGSLERAQRVSGAGATRVRGDDCGPRGLQAGSKRPSPLRLPATPRVGGGFRRLDLVVPRSDAQRAIPPSGVQEWAILDGRGSRPSGACGPAKQWDGRKPFAQRSRLGAFRRRRGRPTPGPSALPPQAERSPPAVFTFAPAPGACDLTALSESHRSGGRYQLEGTGFRWVRALPPELGLL